MYNFVLIQSDSVDGNTIGVQFFPGTSVGGGQERADDLIRQYLAKNRIAGDVDVEEEVEENPVDAPGSILARWIIPSDDSYFTLWAARDSTRD